MHLLLVESGGDLALVGSSAAAAGMVRAVLDHARHFRHHPLVDDAALHVLRSKNRQGLLPCSPASTPGPAGP